MLAVDCKAVHKTYEQGALQVNALKNINLEIMEGDYACLSGPSGSGKTTLLNLIGGLDNITSGSIRVAGEEIHDMNRAQLAQLRLNNIGFVFQAYNLIPVLSAQENVEMVMQLQGVEAAERHKKAKAILAEVGLQGMENRRPAELSGGQQQRVAVARAIVSNPKLVLADEPTANLDSHTAEQLLNIMAELNKEHNITFIISTHDPLVMSHARRLIKLHDGEIVDDVAQ